MPSLLASTAAWIVLSGSPSILFIQDADAPESTASDDSDLTATDKVILNSALAIEDNIAELRGRDFLREVDKVVLTREELAEELRVDLEEEEAQQDVALESLLLRAVGALGDDEDLANIYRSIYTVMINGFYDPSDEQLHCISSKQWSTQIETMVHELYHALQDQHFDLSEFANSDEMTHDAYRARQAVIEGEAEAFTAAYMDEHPFGGIGMRFGGRFGGAAGSSGLNDVIGGGPASNSGFDPEELLQTLAAEQIPIYFRNESIWPYLAGERFVNEQRADGGWEAIAALYETPPVSTEQVAHPEKFRAGELPLLAEFRVPAWLRELGYQERIRDTFGEVATMNLIHELSKDGIHAVRGSEGWGGDCAIVLTREDGEPMFVWRTRWDSERDADEFMKAWRRSAQKELMARTDSPVWLVEVDHTRDPRKATAREGREVVEDHDYGSLSDLPDGMSFHWLAVEDFPVTWIVRGGTQVLVFRGRGLCELDPLETVVPMMSGPFLTREQATRARRAY